ncbi:phospholipase D-like domain-containing protein [Halalkalibacter nanhaiisediminis]|uniref:phospholipase D n=1 Tax=Halalkalibacter nanhaiisediminis TaxID=688079 RepID=A0A562QT29_9BACI|nr:phospholipase D-like domain-containing protein [Halalkalibacter nanhaiisediminis]TWI59894.1 phospholipase D-like protein [Halalkalibacter nanhaiisediminis]
MEIRPFFSRPGNTCEIREALFEGIKAANDKIYLSMAYIDDEEIISQIIESKVSDKRVILNLAHVKNNLENYESHFKGLFDKITKVLGSDEGYYSTMHHKFVILDNCIWVGSYNFTNAAKERNWENMTCIKGSDELVKSYEEEFYHMWNTGAYLSSELNKKISYKAGKLFCKDCTEEINDVVKHFLVEFNAFDYNMEGLERYTFICNRGHLYPNIVCNKCNSTFSREQMYSVGFADHFGDGEERYFCPTCFTKIKQEKALTAFPVLPVMEELIKDVLSESCQSYKTVYCLIKGYEGEEIFRGDDIELAKFLGYYPGEFRIGTKVKLEQDELRVTNTKNHFNKNEKIISISLE